MGLNTYKVLGQVNTGAVGSLPVSTVALTSNVATLTTSVAHGLKVGDRVYVLGNSNSILNGSVLVASVPTTTTFTYPRTNANIPSAATTTTSITKLSVPVGLAITNKVKTNGMATLTMSSTSAITAGDRIDVYINDANFDGSGFLVYDVPTGTTLRYMYIGTDVATAAVTSGALSSYAPTTIYTVPVAKEAIASQIIVNNVNYAGLSARFSLNLVLSGESGQPAKSVLIPFTDIQDGEIISFTLGASFSGGDKLVLVPNNPGISMTVMGTEISYA
jgi:hypothetical protein